MKIRIKPRTVIAAKEWPGWITPEREYTVIQATKDVFQIICDDGLPRYFSSESALPGGTFYNDNHTTPPTEGINQD